MDETFLLRSATLADGCTADVVIRGGKIEHVLTPGTQKGGKPAPTAEATQHEIDLRGYLLLPSPVEPHAHLDKALLGRRVKNTSGDLPGAIAAIKEAYESMTSDDIGRRGLQALTEALQHGFTAVRTHADCRMEMGTGGVEALLELREHVSGLIDLQVVALAGELTGPDAAANRANLVKCMELGADLVGGVPSLEQNPAASLKEFFAIATDSGSGLDLHVDETTDATVAVLRQLAEGVVMHGFDLPVTASHCVSLGMLDAETVRDTARIIATAGISIVALPQTNLFLQGRAARTQKPRGLTAIEDLLEAGVCVAGGGDNWRDPFNPMGRIDAMETASLLVAAGHLLVPDAYNCVSMHARTVMGLPAVKVESGYPADLLAIRATSLEEAIAGSDPERIIFKAGTVVARTAVIREVDTRLATTPYGEVQPSTTARTM